MEFSQFEGGLEGLLDFLLKDKENKRFKEI